MNKKKHLHFINTNRTFFCVYVKGKIQEDYFSICHPVGVVDDDIRFYSFFKHKYYWRFMSKVYDSYEEYLFAKVTI